MMKQWECVAIFWRWEHDPRPYVPEAALADAQIWSTLGAL